MPLNREALSLTLLLNQAASVCRPALSPACFRGRPTTACVQVRSSGPSSSRSTCGLCASQCACGSPGCCTAPLLPRPHPRCAWPCPPFLRDQMPLCGSFRQLPVPHELQGRSLISLVVLACKHAVAFPPFLSSVCLYSLRSCATCNYAALIMTFNEAHMPAGTRRCSRDSVSVSGRFAGQPDGPHQADP